MNKETETLIRLLKDKREREGYSIRKLSSIVGVSFSTLARIERGEGKPDNNTKIRILEWLGEDARQAGLKFNSVALVHFRAKKQIDSNTVQHLLEVADFFKQKHNLEDLEDETILDIPDLEQQPSIPLSKAQMELMAENLRKDLGLNEEDALDPFKLKVDGVEVLSIDEIPDFSNKLKKQLTYISKDCWSAMSIPINLSQDKWVIIWNSSQYRTRQRATLLEEFWHIWLGHRPTKITKVADAYGRTFDEVEEHDAFYLATASLISKSRIQKLIDNNENIFEIAKRYGISKQLIEYRIKRLGLWRQYKKINVTLND